MTLHRGQARPMGSEKNTHALVVISILFGGTALLLTLGKYVKSRLPTTKWTVEIGRRMLGETIGDDDRHS